MVTVCLISLSCVFVCFVLVKAEIDSFTFHHYQYRCVNGEGREPNVHDSACESFFRCSNFTAYLAYCPLGHQFSYEDLNCKPDVKVWCNGQRQQYKLFPKEKYDRKNRHKTVDSATRESTLEDREPFNDYSSKEEFGGQSGADRDSLLLALLLSQLLNFRGVPLIRGLLGNGLVTAPFLGNGGLVGLGGDGALGGFDGAGFDGGPGTGGAVQPGQGNGGLGAGGQGQPPQDNGGLGVGGPVLPGQGIGGLGNGGPVPPGQGIGGLGNGGPLPPGQGIGGLGNGGPLPPGQGIGGLGNGGPLPPGQGIGGPGAAGQVPPGPGIGGPGAGGPIQPGLGNGFGVGVGFGGPLHPLGGDGGLGNQLGAGNG